jgi:uncharacterized Zn-binding protein involved in type VI secretion
MPKKVARVGDSISHGGTITTGSSTKMTNNKKTARVGDTASCSKHGTVTIITGAGTTFADNKKVARVGDSLSCGATITTGSGDTDAE